MNSRVQNPIDLAVEAQAELMVAVRRHLHAHPEPSNQERETTRYLAELLGDHGIATRPGPGGCGLVADSGRGPYIALRADIDALHIADSKQADYRSTVDGVMHACGHDGHAAALVGAVLALHQAAPDSGWRAIFQPAEETNEGALRMIDTGVLEGVERIFALHMDPSRPAGTVGWRAGAFTADCDELHITVRGKGGHASRPYEAQDPVAVAAHLLTAIYQFVPRGIEAHHPVVVTIGHIAGGEQYNVIPDTVRMVGTIRSIGAAVRERTIDHLHQLARGIGDASDTRIEVEILPGPPSVHNEAGCTESFRACAVDLLGEEQVQHIEFPSMGGEDFAHYLKKVPGCMFRLGCAREDGEASPLHASGFDLDERCLAVGAKLLARLAWSR